MDNSPSQRIVRAGDGPNSDRSSSDAHSSDHEGGDWSFSSIMSSPASFVNYGSDVAGLLSSPCSESGSAQTTSLHWFRLSALRLHDNPALLAALNQPLKCFRGVFIVDPWFASADSRFEMNRWKFLLECLHDLDEQLRSLDTRLYVVQGQTTVVLDKLIREWNVSSLTYQVSPEPFGRMEEVSVDELARILKVPVQKYHSHVLYDPEEVLKVNNAKPLVNFKAFKSILPKIGAPNPPLPPPTLNSIITEDDTLIGSTQYRIPTLEDLGFPRTKLYTNSWIGGERQALSRLPHYCAIRETPFEGVDMLFDKSSLSPYVRFGCLSVRYFWRYVKNLADHDRRKSNLMKEVTGKLLQRELFLISASQVPNFDCAFHNPICLPIPWNEDRRLFRKWLYGQTGYPWIDAAMRQMHREGWMHNVLRESVATFLTRGDLWINWVHGKDTFEKYMLDFEPSLSCGCWMRSASCAFVSGRIEHYSPITYGQKIDPEGLYIREYVPELKDYPSEYIHSPWLAPVDVQRQSSCIVGIDYPHPIVDHDAASELCKEKLKEVVCMAQTTYTTGHLISSTEPLILS